jgi:hypothetical protein
MSVPAPPNPSASALPRRRPRASAAHNPTPRPCTPQFFGIFLHPEVIMLAHLESRVAQGAIACSTTNDSTFT